jgi:arsenate reductase-like glutaredoxin family protein
MAREAHRLIATKGKKVISLDLLKERPSHETIANLMLGPTGNMRAPTIRLGRTLLVGYNDQVFAEEIG